MAEVWEGNYIIGATPDEKDFCERRYGPSMERKCEDCKGPVFMAAHNEAYYNENGFKFLDWRCAFARGPEFMAQFGGVVHDGKAKTITEAIRDVELQDRRN